MGACHETLSSHSCSLEGFGHSDESSQRTGFGCPVGV